MAMTGHFDLANFALGFAFGFLVLFLLQRVLGRSSYFTKSMLLVRFAGFYALEVVRSNLRVAFDVVTPALRAEPGVVAVPLEARTDAEITLLANLITMTPGTLAVDVAGFSPFTSGASVPSLVMVGYAIVYAIVALMLALWSFEHRDL